MEFPWRCNVDTIAMDLKVSWEMSSDTIESYFDSRLKSDRLLENSIKRMKFNLKRNCPGRSGPIKLRGDERSGFRDFP